MERNSDRDLNPNDLFNDSNAFGAKLPWPSVERPWGCSQAQGVQEHFRRASPHCSIRVTIRDQHKSLGAVSLLEVLAFPESGTFDEQFMGQSTLEEASEEGRELRRVQITCNNSL